MCADVRSRVADLADRYWQVWTEAHPITSTSFGSHENDDRLEDRRPEARARYRRLVADILAEADAVATDQDRGTDETLRPHAIAPDAVTLSALISQLRGELDEIDADLRAWTVDALEGPQVEIFNVESFQPDATPEEGRRLLARWRAMATWIEQHRANLREAAGDGLVATHAPVAHVVDAMTDVLAQPDETWALLNPARAEHPDWPAAELSAYREGLREAVSSQIRPALVRLRDTLRDDILPAARRDDRPGVMYVPGGAEAYRRLIRAYTSLDFGPEELHRIGLAELDRIHDEMRRLGERVLGTSDHDETVRRLRGDPDLYFRTSDEVAEAAARALACANEAIPAWFGVLPRAACIVVRMGDHEAKYGTVAYYRHPDPSGSRPGNYFINATEPRTRPRYEAETLAYHESVPGHHLQIAIMQEIPDLPEFRRHLGVTAFFEGWGLYAERLADEMGLYSSDLDRIGILSFDAWRACRLVVDTGMHAMGWTRQQAIDLMLQHTALAPNNIANEVDRYITWPGQALAYKVGQLELLSLRAEMRDRLGPQFDIRRFHDAVLANGAVGLTPLRRLVEAALLPG